MTTWITALLTYVHVLPYTYLLPTYVSLLGHYSFTVAVKSDSYLGVDVSQDIKLDVHEARDVPNEHPQWEFEDEDEDENSKAEESDDEFATDDDFEDEDVSD